ncbi:MAG: tRNA 2-thiouridine(34) synthase MnmA, partial [Terriglobia bacterium]
MKQRVLAAMSGGVDSVVAALLLRQQGYEVIGITMQVWPAADDGKPGAESFGGCCSVQAVSDAKRVAALLGVPHYVLNFRKPFEERVVRRFCEEYVAGRTPNPCILCNRF